MQPASGTFKSGRGQDWTAERIDRLGTPDVQQLRENAEKLGAAAVVALCDASLKARGPKTPASRAASGAVRKLARRLISRTKAFQARGVYLSPTDSGWCGVRKSDGAVVMSLWGPAIVSTDGSCSQLLWAPNADGTRPWSDLPAGQERLKHCKLGLERGAAEGVLVYGEQLEGECAEHNARSVYGADPECVIQFQVEQRGAEYWAVWGAKVVERPL
jgi:hypothetical protein